MILTAVGMKTAFLTLLAYLLSNGLLSGKTLVFFTDGAKDLRGHIVKWFALRNQKLLSIFLRENLSMPVALHRAIFSQIHRHIKDRALQYRTNFVCGC